VTYEEVEKEWKSGKAHPVYVFAGEEEFLRSELLHQLPDLFLPEEGTRSFNYDLLYGPETSMGDVIAIAQGYPMMAEWRIVVVKEAERILRSKPASTSSKKKAKSEEDPLLSYLDRPNKETILVFDLAKMGPKNQSPYKELAAKAELVEFPVLKEPLVLEWLKKRAKKFKKQLSEPAARLLIAHLGTDLRTHANELEKLITFRAGSDTITEQDVEQVVGISRTFNIFELTKAIGSGQKVRATEIALRMLAEDKDQRQYMFVMIARYLEQLIVAREMLQKGENERAIAEALELRGGAAFFVKEFIEAAKRYSREQLDQAMHMLVELEAETRRVQTSDLLLMERLMAHIIPTARV